MRVRRQRLNQNPLYQRLCRRLRIRSLLAFVLALLLALGLAPVTGGWGPRAAMAQSPRLTDIRATSNGLLLRLTGAAIPNLPVTVQRIGNPDRLAVDLPGVDVPAFLHNSQMPLNRYGVSQVRVAQFQKQPPIARVVLDLADM
ncbi:MAG: AMIN domain-containing protein, partial [Pseudanabaenaceae cyanobacterium]